MYTAGTMSYIFTMLLLQHFISFVFSNFNQSVSKETLRF